MALDNEEAQALARAAHRHAEQLGVRISVAIVDAGANLIALSRMDGAMPLSSRVAVSKASAAALLQRDGGTVAALDANQPTAFAALGVLAGMPLFPGLGSLPIRDADAVAGAIGVSGATAAQDLECAEAALAEVRGPSEDRQRVDDRT